MHLLLLSDDLTHSMQNALNSLKQNLSKYATFLFALSLSVTFLISYYKFIVLYPRTSSLFFFLKLPPLCSVLKKLPTKTINIFENQIKVLCFLKRVTLKSQN